MFFAGLAPACNKIDKEYHGKVSTFKGGESPEETLLIMGVPIDDIPKQIKEGCQYDKELLKFGEGIIKPGNYKHMKAPERNMYKEIGTNKDIWNFASIITTKAVSSLLSERILGLIPLI